MGTDYPVLINTKDGGGAGKGRDWGKSLLFYHFTRLGPGVHKPAELKRKNAS
jgi:hypothetical protein